ncbi:MULTISPECIES: signal peptidase I [unclassified Kocuria]|uniref:signal peptidase I n=1 Tax=unclassified Kocuria TaxID=2649579 RepID=UPI000A7792E8|nr:MULTISPECIES: signal peptidase I [unclassified Kocuria]
MADRTPTAGDGAPRESRGATGDAALPAVEAPGTPPTASTVPPEDSAAAAEDADPGQGSTARRGRRSRGSRSRKQRPDTFWGSVREIVLVLVWAVLIAFVVKTLLVRGFYIPSGSMENTLQLNDRIFVNVVEPTFGPLERGDIVVFEDAKGWLPAQPDSGGGPADAVYDALAFVGVLPDRTDQHLIKRVIGVGGDRVVCCDGAGRVTVNGQALEEDGYLYPGSAPSDIPFDIVVPEDHYFVMGDHRDASADSRVHFSEIVADSAFISHDDVVGTAFVIAWPLDRFQWLQNPDDVFADIPAGSAGGS